MKAGLWKTDWFLGAVVVLVVLVFNRSSDLIPSLEQKAYDLGVQSTSRLPSDKVAVIAIDDTSIANIGRWPWSREIHARMTDLLAGAFLAIGLFVSSTTENQIVSGFGTFGALLSLWLLGWFADSAQGALRTVVQQTAIIEHMEGFAKGVIDTKDLVYYLSVIVFALFLTLRSLESKRWRG